MNREQLGRNIVVRSGRVNLEFLRSPVDRSLLDDTIGDTATNAYLQFAGSLPDEDYREITEILKSTEQVDEQ